MQKNFINIFYFSSISRILILKYKPCPHLPFFRFFLYLFYAFDQHPLAKNLKKKIISKIDKLTKLINNFASLKFNFFSNRFTWCHRPWNTPYSLNMAQHAPNTRYDQILKYKEECCTNNSKECWRNVSPCSLPDSLQFCFVIVQLQQQ